MKGVVLAVCLVFVLSVVAVAARPHLQVALPSPLVRHVHFVDQTPDRRKYISLSPPPPPNQFDRSNPKLKPTAQKMNPTDFFELDPILMLWRPKLGTS
jgi:hypothetical protein